MKKISVQAKGILLLLLLFSGAHAGSAAPELPAYDRVRALQPPRSIADAELVDHDGEPFRLSQLRGRVALVFFGFTNCPDVCPAALQKLALLERSAGPELDELAYVMISVDGERDTPDVLKRFLGQVSPSFIGVTGEPGNVKAMAKAFSAAFFKGSMEKHGGYNVSHSPQVFVVDPAGMLRAEFYFASIEAMKGITLALLNEAEQKPEAGAGAH